MKIFYRPATHPIHFAADSPDKIIAALRGRYFSFSQSTEFRQCKEKHGFPAGVQKCADGPNKAQWTNQPPVLWQGLGHPNRHRLHRNEVTMNKLLSCRYNMDTNRVEVRFEDGTTLAIDCIAVEDEYGSTPAQRAELDWLLYNKPLYNTAVK